MVDSDAFERKLAAVYSAIDGNSYKSAVKLADAALKKYKGHQQLRALRAYSLQRCGRGGEALAAVAELVAEGPESEQVLHIMSFTYKGAGRPADATAAYAAAAEKRPGSVDILVGLFGAYAKELNYVKQQQVALKLAKVDPENAEQYGWWAVCCAALQARAALRIEPGSKLGQLADTMAARQVTRCGGVPSYEALLLHLDILLGQGKFAEAAAAVEAAPAAAAGMGADRAQLLAAAYARGGAFDAAAPIYLQASLDSPDDWMTWHLYLDCMLPGSAAASVPGASRFPVGVAGGLTDAWEARHGLQPWKEGAARQDEVAMQAALEAAEEALHSLQAAAAQWAGSERGAALAGVELELRRLRLGLPGAEQRLAVGVAAAFPALSTLFSCAADLRPYLARIRDPAICAWLAEQVQLCAGMAEDESVADAAAAENGARGNSAAIKRLQRRASVHSVLHELGLPKVPSLEAAVAHAASLVQIYAEHLPLSEKLDPKERGNGEELVALAAGALASACRAALPLRPSQAAAAPPLLLALLSLEAAQVRRKVSAPLRLACVALYSLLGAPRLAAAHFSALDIKSILHDTMTGHWLLPALLGGAADAELGVWLAGLRGLHQDQVIEAADALMTVYEQGTYSKVAEFVDFRERLAQSHSRALGLCEGAALQLRATMPPAGKAATAAAQLRSAAEALAGPRAADDPQAAAQPQELRFNEDLSTRPAWFPPPTASARLAVLAWWEDAGPSAGYAHSWWSPVASAERDHPAAHQWRRSSRAELRLRRHLPALLAGVLSEQPLPADALASLQQRLAGAYCNKGGAGAEGKSAEAALRTALSALFAAGLAVHEAVAAVVGSKGSAGTFVTEACTQLAALQAASQLAGSRAAALLAPTENDAAAIVPLRANGGFALASALLTEEAEWCAACLQSWAKLCRPPAKAAAAMPPGLETLHAAIGAAAASLHGTVSAVDASLLATCDADTGAAAERAVAELRDEWQGQRLWAWEPCFDPAQALRELFEDQRATAGRLRAAALRTLAVLKPLLPTAARSWGTVATLDCTKCAANA